jgi:hypothetical protein
MAKTKTKKENSTTTKIKELTGVKPEQISDEHLNEVQEVVTGINRAQMDIGQMEVRKHSALHFIATKNDELTLVRDKFEQEYGTSDINLETGIINYPENGETDKKD